MSPLNRRTFLKGAALAVPLSSLITDISWGTPYVHQPLIPDTVGGTIMFYSRVVLTGTEIRHVHDDIQLRAMIQHKANVLADQLYTHVKTALMQPNSEARQDALDAVRNFSGHIS